MLNLSVTAMFGKKNGKPKRVKKAVYERELGRL